MHQITVTPSQVQFNDQESETILAAAIRNGINLPHACQSGVCGSCRAKLISGSIKQHTEYDDYVLTPEEIQANMFLLCCTQAQSNLIIDMPTYAGSKAQTIRTLPTRINAIHIKGSIAIIHIALPKAPPFNFYAGQYMDFLFKEGSRSYSIANAPSQKDQLEFHIRLRENGLFSSQLLDGRLTVGSIIRLRGPLGAFTLSANHHKPLILLATGTGLAPIKSILCHLSETIPHRPIHLYYGCRTQADLYDETQLNNLLSQLPNARYTPVLSQAKSGWTGATGYLTPHVIHDYPNLAQHEVYACGSPAMIQESRTLLTQQSKLPEDAFFSDAFTPHIS